MGAALSTEVRDFIDQNITAYEDLQVLLLMHGNPRSRWDAVDVAESLRIEPLSAARHLMHLYRRGLVDHTVERGPLYDFNYNAQKESYVSALALAFDKAREEVVDYIFARRRGELQSFADAFKLTKDK